MNTIGWATSSALEKYEDFIALGVFMKTWLGAKSG
ncbi:MAG: hypothetical protein ACJAXQ_000969 [Parvibaculaceae bacterium]|jgi:hypothetical protein